MERVAWVPDRVEGMESGVNRRECVSVADVNLFRSCRGFAAKAPEKVLESVQAWGTEYNALVEDDLVITLDNNNL